MTIKITMSSDPENRQDLETFFNNIDSIIKNKDRILNTPELYQTHLQGSGIFGLYIGKTKLFLGDLLKLWEKTAWRDGDKYYYSVGGSPLSGMSFCRYWSKSKGFGLDRNKPSFGTLAFPALKMLNGILVEQKTHTIPAQTPVRTSSALTIKQFLEKTR